MSEKKGVTTVVIDMEVTMGKASFTEMREALKRAIKRTPGFRLVSITGPIGSVWNLEDPDGAPPLL